MGGSQSTRLVQPEVLRDEANARQPSASRVVKERLVQMASDDDYEPHMQMLSGANPEVAVMLAGSVGQQLVEEAAEFDGTSPVADDEDADDDDDTEAEVDNRKRLKKSATVEFLLCVMMRLGNMHVMPFFVTILSVVALKSGMSQDNWSVLMLLSAQFNERWVHDFCVMLSAVVAREVEGVHSTHIRLAVFDNCSYMRRNKFQSEDSDGGMVHTVNWMRLPLDTARFGAQVARGAWHNGSRTFLCRRLFAPKHPKSQRFLLDTWLSMVQLAMRLKREGADDWTLLLLTRPSSHTATRTFTIYMDPVLNVGTAAYADVDRVLKVIFNFYVVTCVMPAAIVLLVGDQQSYNRMIWQKKLSRKVNDWYVPLPGEFHFVVHALMAIHRLWFVALSSWANDALGWHKTIKEEWTSVEEWHHYDRFYLLLIAVLTAYLLEIVPSRMLLQPVLLRDAVAGNASASMIVRFLFEFGYPYLALRNAIRANDHASSAVHTRTATTASAVHTRIRTVAP